jgi:hypothetical protein
VPINVSVGVQVGSRKMYRTSTRPIRYRFHAGSEGDPGLRLRTSQDEGHREDSQDGRGMCMLPVSENPHRNTVNDALTSDFPLPDDSQ